MNSLFFKSTIINASIITLLLHIVSACADPVSNNKPITLPQLQLDANQTAMFDHVFATEVDYCKDLKKNNSEKDIYYCLEYFDSWYALLGYKLLNKTKPTLYKSVNLLSGYLGDKIMPYVLSLPKQRQAVFLSRYISHQRKSPVFIKRLIKEGVPLNNQLLSFGNVPNTMSCDTQLILINQNIGLYKNKHTLFEIVSQPHHPETKTVRWNDLLVVSGCMYQNPCPSVMRRLAQAFPEMPNIQDKDVADGYTALHKHAYCVDHGPSNINGLLESFKIVVTKKNINMQTVDGRTALHALLHTVTKKNEHIVISLISWLISNGADIDIQDNSGETPRELILKHKLTVILPPENN